VHGGRGARLEINTCTDAIGQRGGSQGLGKRGGRGGSLRSGEWFGRELVAECVVARTWRPLSGRRARRARTWET
jgi:hypothetical protein